MRSRLSATLLLSALLAQAQTITLSGPPNVRSGATATVTIQTTGGTASAILWQTNGLPPGASITAGAQATAAGKSIKCNAGLCIVFGLNQTSIPNGELAKISFTAPATGPVNLSLTTPTAGTGAGTAVAITAGPTLSIPVLSRFDLNGDGVVDVVDLNLAVDQILGITTCAAADFDGNGKCDLFDALALIIKAITGVGN